MKKIVGAALLSLLLSQSTEGRTIKNEKVESLLSSSQSIPSKISNRFVVDRSDLSLNEIDKIISITKETQIIIHQNTHRITYDGGKTWTQQIQNKNLLFLKNYQSVDPLYDSERNKNSEFRRFIEGMKGEQERVSVIIQFHTQVLQVYKEKLSSIGSEIRFYLPHNSLIVTVNRSQLEQIQSWNFIRWIGHYEAGYKVSKSIIEQAHNSKLGPYQKYNVMLLERGEEAQRQAEQMIESAWVQGRVVQKMNKGFRMIVVLRDMEAIMRVANMEQVMYIDQWTEPSEDMDVARLSGGVEYVSKVAGYNGERIRAEVMDSGLYVNHGDFVANPPILHGSNCASTSHGTSVYGIVFGDGTGNPAALGGLPKAEAGIFACYSVLNDRYNHTQELIEEDGKYRAVFQTNSWGDSQTTEYTSVSAEMDDIIFDTDILILQSQSNTGSSRSRPQAWSKNILSIGGFYHYGTITRTDDAWAGGASTGFAEDGRHKPDLCNFYDEILTTSSSGPRSYTSFGGTSGATPITAGHLGVMFQMWADGVFSGSVGKDLDPFDARPHSSTSKALMINTADQFPFDEDTTDLTRKHQGWGVANVATLYDAAKRGRWRLPLLVDESYPLKQLAVVSYSVNVPIGRRKSYLKVTLAYRDPMPLVSASKQLINDLDLYVQSPTGEIYWGNNGLNLSPCSTPDGEPEDIDNVENVFVCNATPGIWTISVYGTSIVEDTYPETPEIDAVFSLVATIGR